MPFIESYSDALQAPSRHAPTWSHVQLDLSTPEAAQSGLTALWLSNEDRWTALAYSLLRNAADVEDSLSETYIAVLTHYKRLRSAEHASKVFTLVLKRKCFDALRRRRGVSLESESVNVDARTARSASDGDVVDKSVAWVFDAALPSDKRILHTIYNAAKGNGTDEGMDVDYLVTYTAERCKCSVQTVRNVLHGLRAALQGSRVAGWKLRKMTKGTACGVGWYRHHRIWSLLALLGEQPA